MKNKTLLTIVALTTCMASYAAGATNKSTSQSSSTATHVQYLSGHGADDPVKWQFKCTDGRNSGSWTTIDVPSCWELQGFGTYQYGMRFYGIAQPEGIASEKGLYKYEFNLPQEWEGKQIELVFEAVMTDCKVTINGRKAGSGGHQGGFTRFSFDVSDRIYFGSKTNRLEVEVSKESTDKDVNLAERRADFWNFGGIFRPVFVVCKPVQNIQRVAINAGMDGLFKADVYTNRVIPGGSVRTDIIDSGGKVIATGTTPLHQSDRTTVQVQAKDVRLWTAETPNRYTARMTLLDANGQTLHVEHEKFGFRTIEYRESDGVYINGQRVIFRGVNRHSFRPETGRTLSKRLNIEDVELIKSMNMNAVRLSHYPADPEFLDACDSLGLYVENELIGWHFPHNTLTGTKLVKEMVTRDVNHPSVIFWSNGNEGGFNYDLDGEFGRWDPQQRVVLYPWANRNGFETKHYRSYGETQDYMRQKEIFMPTEFLHGLYDGGHGAGLEDYWQMMMSNPRCAGGFLWDLMDQGVVRTDKDGIIDCMGNFGADGIVGPHMEKEGSYYTIKEVWCPVQPDFSALSSGRVTVENRYNFTNISDISFTYRYLTAPSLGQADYSIVKQGKLQSPDIKPGERGELTLPAMPSNGVDIVELTATDRDGREIMQWREEMQHAAASQSIANAASATYKDNTVTAGSATYSFDPATGYITAVSVKGHRFSLSNGPRLVAARRSDRSYDQFYNHDDAQAEKKKTLYTEYADQGVLDKMEWSDADKTLTVSYRHGSLDTVSYQFCDDGSVMLRAAYNFGGVVDLMGLCIDYPEQQVKHKTWLGKGPYRVWQNRMKGPQYGVYSNDYNDPVPGESWDYPEFKGYFADVRWLQLETTEGLISISDLNDHQFIGIYTPRDGRDELLYTLPQTGLALMNVIPAVRNKVNTTDLNGPSAQPKWMSGKGEYVARLRFDAK